MACLLCFLIIVVNAYLNITKAMYGSNERLVVNLTKVDLNA